MNAPPPPPPPRPKKLLPSLDFESDYGPVVWLETGLELETLAYNNPFFRYNYVVGLLYVTNVSVCIIPPPPPRPPLDINPWL